MTAITVTAPDPGFAGTRAGVTFQDGRGEVDAEDASALAYFARHGYALEAPLSPAKKERSSAAAPKPTSTPATEGDPADA
jgi:hypothetical protein